MDNIVIEKMNIYHYNKIKDVIIDEFDEFWNKDILKEELENDNTRYIVAMLEDNVIGFAGLKYNFETVEIMNIVTKKDMRKKGVADLLIKKLIEISSDFNVDRIQLEVKEDNIPAINLYKKNGFKQVGVRKNYYNGKFDAILMDYIL